LSYQFQQIKFLIRYIKIFTASTSCLAEQAGYL